MRIQRDFSIHTGRHRRARRALPVVLSAALSALGLGSTAVPAWGGEPIPSLTADGRPNVQARAAVVMDVATGGELFATNPNKISGIASTTKIFVAMVVRRRNIDLDAMTSIEKVDRDHARGGARTRLGLFHSFTNRDLLRAMLIASDNRAPTALGRAVGLSPDELVDAMNELAHDLGLRRTTFTDPSGLRGNKSTPREMALAFRESLADPVLREIMATREVTIRSKHSRPRAVHYRNTNNALHSQRYPVTGGKTGYTRAAGYCLLIAAELRGREVIMVFLGERDKLTRYGDFNRVARWIAAGSAPPLDTLATITGTGDLPHADVGASASGVGSL